ncbi:MAG TPA: hypothetical protein VFA07_19105 [Chthonomonadaceae bacterium]|nr:hypothetical protein [Chthonomonadaceae bacterium]
MLRRPKNAGEIGLFIGLLALALPARGQSTPPAFETFVVPKAPQATPQAANGAASGPASTLQPRKKPGKKKSSYGERLNAQVALTLFPGRNDLSFNMAGQLGGRQWTSQLNPLPWLQGDFTNTGFVRIQHGNSAIQIGDAYSDLLGSAQGIRLVSPWKSHGSSLGLGLYERLRDGNVAGGVFALDNSWKLGKTHTASILLAADSSWRLTHHAEGVRWQLDSFAGRDANTRRLEAGMGWEGRLSRAAVLSGRVTGWNGGGSGLAWALGWNQTMGRTVATFDMAQSRQLNTLQRQGGIAILAPLGRDVLGFRWRTLTAASNGQGSAGDTTVLATWLHPVSMRTTFWSSAGWDAQQGVQPQILLTLGGSRDLGRHWDLQAEITDRPAIGQFSLRLGLGYQFNADWQLRLLVGPAPAASLEGPVSHVFGFQLVHNFDITCAPSGSVRGQVLVQGKPCVQPIEVSIDDDDPVTTDAQGRFLLRRVPPGKHTVHLDLAQLPADYNAAISDIDVDVKNGKTSQVRFSVQRVGQVRGVVHVGADAFGQIDPTAGMSISVSAGSGIETLTDTNNEFVLGDLPPGKHRIALVAQTLPPDYDVVGPAEVEVMVDPDKPCSPIVFSIAPHHRAIDYGGPNGGK